MLAFKLSFVPVLLTIASWFGIPHQVGQVSAHVDVLLGRHEILTLGLPPPWLPHYRDLLQKRYGVTIRPIAAGMIMPSQLGYAIGYNSVSVPAIQQKLGEKIVTQVRTEAESRWMRLNQR
jgi:hypothetical protein